MKILLNLTYGGFSLSEDVVLKAMEKGMDPDLFYEADWKNAFYRNKEKIDEMDFRTHEILIEAAEEVKEEGGFICGEERAAEYPGGDERESVAVVKINPNLRIKDNDGKESLKAGPVYEEILTEYGY